MFRSSEDQSSACLLPFNVAQVKRPFESKKWENSRAPASFPRPISFWAVALLHAKQLIFAHLKDCCVSVTASLAFYSSRWERPGSNMVIMNREQERQEPTPRLSKLKS